MAYITNQATLSYNGNVTNSNITTGEPVAVLSVTKTAVTDNYTAGDDVTYVDNSVQLYSNGVLQATPTVAADNVGSDRHIYTAAYPQRRYLQRNDLGEPDQLHLRRDYRKNCDGCGPNIFYLVAMFSACRICIEVDRLQNRRNVLK